MTRTCVQPTDYLGDVINDTVVMTTVRVLLVLAVISTVGVVQSLSEDEDDDELDGMFAHMCPGRRRAVNRCRHTQGLKN